MNSNSSLETVILVSKHEEKLLKKSKNYKVIHQMELNMTDKFKERTFHQTNLNCDKVSQHIQVDENNFQCIINLNTTVCTSKSEGKKHHRKHKTRHSKRHRKHEDPKNTQSEKNCKFSEGKSRNKEHNNKQESQNPEEEFNKSRFQEEKCKNSVKAVNTSAVKITPRCFRGTCWNYCERKKENIRRNNVHNIDFNRNKHKKNLSKNEVRKTEVNPSKHHHRHRHTNQHSQIKIQNQTESRILLSPISSSPFKDTENYGVSYDDVSSISLDLYVKKKPIAYKRYHRSQNERHIPEERESKLDTLIKRSKARERKQVEMSRCDSQWWTSTPVHNEYSSADFPINSSDMDISMNSTLSTLVLEASKYTDAYSLRQSENLIHNEDYQSVETQHNIQVYSPGSPTRNYKQTPPKHLDFNKLDFKLENVKIESSMDIQAYSPTPTLEYNSIKIKEEVIIKSEPIFSCPISPIYPENCDDTGLKLCKIENVKSEFIDDYVEN